MKTNQSTNGPGVQNAGNDGKHNRLNHPEAPAASWPCPKRQSPNGSAGGRTVLALATGVLVLATSAQAQISNANEFGPDNWIAIGDGIRGANGEVVDTVTDATGNLYVGGNFNVIGDVVANGIAKWDGKAWSALGSGMDDQVITLAVSGTNLYAGGVFTTAGGVEVNKVAKWDGSHWSALGTGITGTEVSELVVMGDTLYAGGLFSAAGGVAVSNIAKWDGTSWSALGSGVDTWALAMAVDGTDLYVGGRFTEAGGMPANLVAKWDGNAWSSLGFDGSFGSPAQVRFLRMFGSDLYAGGRFVNAGADDEGDYIAKWDGVEWSALGTGLSDEVRSMAASEDALYVGGEFITAGGIEVNHVAKWDGTSWFALGSGTGPGRTTDQVPVRTVAVLGDTVIAGGDFEEVDGHVANHIARWDGANWSTFGSETFTEIPDVTGSTSSGEATVVKGSGSKAYVGKGSSILEWDGSAWSELGTRFSGGAGLPLRSYPMRNIELSGSDVFVAGEFTAAGGVPANNIAKWDGTSWSGLGDGLDGIAIVLLASGTDLYAGGNFTTAGGSVVNHIAKWDGIQWSPLGTGVDGLVAAILVSGTDVYVAGDFTSAGGVAANRVAKWDGIQWSALGDGLADRVNDLVMWESDLYAADRGSVDKVSKWDGVAWTTVASSDSGEIGLFPCLATSGEGLFVVSYRYNDQEDTTETILSRWDGGAWSVVSLDSSPGTPFPASHLPAVGGAADSLYFANNSLVAGAQLYDSPRTWGLQDKVSPLVSRYFLGNLPALEVGDGRATVFFRGNAEPPSGVLSGHVHRIDRTTDFQTWETLGHRYAGEIGGIDFTDDDAPENQAFYRAVPVTEQ